MSPSRRGYSGTVMVHHQANLASSPAMALATEAQVISPAGTQRRRLRWASRARSPPGRTVELAVLTVRPPSGVLPSAGAVGCRAMSISPSREVEEHRGGGVIAFTICTGAGRAGEVVQNAPDSCATVHRAGRSAVQRTSSQDAKV